MESLSSICLPILPPRIPPNRMAVDRISNPHPRPASFLKLQHHIRPPDQTPSIRPQPPRRIRLCINRTVPLDPPASWYRSMVRRTIPTVKVLAPPTSARLKIVKDGCPLAGSVGKITWVGPTMSIITLGLPPGRGPRITTTNRCSVRRPICSWSVGLTRVACCQRTERARVRRTCRMDRLLPRQAAAPMLFR